MNQTLTTTPYIPGEVTTALFQMAPLKSPGPNGFPAIFFKKDWNIRGTDIISCILDFLNGRRLPNRLNFTFIVLIPKVCNPKRMTGCGYVSLCNVIYKIGSKMIANRLKLFLDDIISPTQSAFVPGRLITDNVLVAYEVNHSIHTRAPGCRSYMALKLDISKAYDRIEWVFLRKVLCRLGVADSLVDTILLCISCISYAFLLNGSQCSSLQPGRGLRQGEPPSPYLFICFTEVFIRMIEQAVRMNKLKGIKITPTAPMISNLCFTDDTILLVRLVLMMQSSFTGF